ncbi:MAG: ABC transporter substrate-binding protein [bacterium]
MRFLGSVGLLVLAIAISSLAWAEAAGGKLDVWVREGYAPADIVKDFERKYNVKVNLNISEDDGPLFDKLVAGAGGVDVMILAHNQLVKFYLRDVLEAIDLNKLSNYRNLYEGFQRVEWAFWDGYEPGKGKQYAVPFVFGTSCLAINTRYISPKGGPISWGVLWDKKFKGKTSARNGPEVIMITVDYLDINRRDFLFNSLPARDGRYKNVRDKVRELKGNVLKFWSGGQEIVELLVGGEVVAAHIWDGGARRAHRDNPEVVMVIPKEGASAWSDAYAIAKNSSNKEAAYLWINYILDPKVGAKIAEAEGFNLTNEAAEKFISPDILENLRYSPSDIRNFKWVENLPDDLHRARLVLWGEIMKD